MVNTFIKINKEIIKPIIASKATNTQNKMKEKFDNNSKIRKYEEGEWIKLKYPKKQSALEADHHGPYQITTSHKDKSYTVQDIEGKIVKGTFAPKDIIPLSDPLIENKKVYEVEQIISHRINKSKLEFKVRWKGYSENEDSWEPLESFDSLLPIKAYEIKHNLKLIN
jgi:hypothetical protein